MEAARKGGVAEDLRELAMDAPGGRAWAAVAGDAVPRWHAGLQVTPEM